MAATVTLKELRTMSPKDIRTEASEKRVSIAKLKMAVSMRSEKDTAKVKRERRQLARMLTVLSEMENSAPAQPQAKKLKSPAKSSKMPA
jgi:ribosomal protein L29